jgi:hypothetical protein
MWVNEHMITNLKKRKLLIALEECTLEQLTMFQAVFGNEDLPEQTITNVVFNMNDSDIKNATEWLKFRFRISVPNTTELEEVIYNIKQELDL